MSFVYSNFAEMFVHCSVCQGCSHPVHDEINFVTSEHDVTSALHALYSLVQQNALDKRLNSSANVPGNRHVYSVYSLV